ncbi:RDD family protein [Sphingobacteriales bacterium UPWRP_1]|nr:hypothetical protein BVG80_13875 [Sphingobacteriales bacterium TSM_CSM]PSJ77069.1 RDD family protein [Sphingobacteriales bacterium UPWRP_1]
MNDYWTAPGTEEHTSFTINNDNYQNNNNPQYAGFWMRLVALIADGLIIGLFQSFVVMPVLALLGYQVTLDPAILESNENLDNQINALLNYLVLVNGVSFVVSWLYYAYLEASPAQATPGKMMMGIKVTDMGGNRINFGKATMRFFSKILSALIFGIGYLMAAFTDKKQALHDMIAGTLVVEKDKENQSNEFI